MTKLITKSMLWELAEYEPHPRQLLYHDSPARFKVAACGRRFGKTKMTMMDKIDRVFTGRSGRWWIVAEEYNVGEEDLTYLEEVLEALRKKFGVRPKSAAHNVKQGELFFEMPWGYRVEVKSARYPKTLVSKGLDCATLSEAAKLDAIVWDKYISPALADRKAPADFASTPEGDNWFKDLYLQGEKGHPLSVGRGGEWESWNFPAWENPVVYPGGFEDPEVKRQMKTKEGTVFFWQEIGASFKALAGAVYPQWSRDTHLLKKGWTYRPEWANYTFWDFGFSNPTAVLDVQVSPQGKWVVWREYYQTGESIFGHIQAIRGRQDPEGYNVACAFGDAADPAAIEEIGKNLYPCYSDPRAKDFATGVQEVQALLSDVEGRQWLWVDGEACPNFVREIPGYKWPKVRSEPTKLIEKPINQPNHLLDALRYGVMHLMVLGGRYKLSDVLNEETLDAMRGVGSRADSAPEPGEVFGPPGEDTGTIFSLSRVGVF